MSFPAEAKASVRRRAVKSPDPAKVHMRSTTTSWKGRGFIRPSMRSPGDAPTDDA
jgi:hypothetical protein